MATPKQIRKSQFEDRILTNYHFPCPSAWEKQEGQQGILPFSLDQAPQVEMSEGGLRSSSSPAGLGRSVFPGSCGQVLGCGGCPSRCPPGPQELQRRNKGSPFRATAGLRPLGTGTHSSEMVNWCPRWPVTQNSGYCGEGEPPCSDTPPSPLFWVLIPFLVLFSLKTKLYSPEASRWLQRGSSGDPGQPPSRLLSRVSQGDVAPPRRVTLRLT